MTFTKRNAQARREGGRKEGRRGAVTRKFEFFPRKTVTEK